MNDIISQLKSLAVAQALPVLLKLGAAIVLWIVGRAVISIARRVLRSAMERRGVEATLIRYIESLFTTSLTVGLLLSILSMFGVETTSFAAVLAAAGFAIGAAWSGLLANFAAGIFLLVLRPFRLGDEIEAGGVSGEVREIGLFVTTVFTADHLLVLVNNAKILEGHITNCTATSYRRLVVKVPLPQDADVRAVSRALLARVAAVPGVLKSPEPSVEIAEFTLVGPVLAVQCFCEHHVHGEVAPLAHLAIQETYAAAGYSTHPQNLWILHVASKDR